MSEGTIRQFVETLTRHDLPALLACYHPQASYSGPVHPDIRGHALHRLWALRLARCAGLRAQALGWEGDERKARLRWEMCWTSRGSASPARLALITTFSFWDAQIVRQVDQFSVWRLLGQTEGLRGWALGWLPATQRRARDRAARELTEFATRGIPT